MKRRFTRSDYKKRNNKKSKKQFKRRLSSIKRRKNRKLRYSKLKKVEVRQQRYKDEFIKVSAPGNFSFIENTEEVLSYIEILTKLFKKRKKIVIDFSKIYHITNDAIVLILSIINNDSNSKFCTIRGNYPRDQKLRKILIESGIFGDYQTNAEYRNYILTRRNKKADGKIADELIKRASKVVFGAAGHCPGVYKALLESMANTCYHAIPDKKAIETWWLTVYHNRELECVSFAFIDLGVGIFKSRNIRLFSENLKSLVGLTDNKELLKEIIIGHKQSSTKLPYRGKGLPSIYKGLERNYYSNLIIISNDVKANLETNNFESLKTEFPGTFLYWELNKKNRWTQLR